MYSQVSQFQNKRVNGLLFVLQNCAAIYISVVLSGFFASGLRILGNRTIVSCSFHTYWTSEPWKSYDKYEHVLLVFVTHGAADAHIMYIYICDVSLDHPKQ